MLNRDIDVMVILSQIVKDETSNCFGVVINYDYLVY